MPCLCLKRRKRVPKARQQPEVPKPAILSQTSGVGSLDRKLSAAASNHSSHGWSPRTSTADDEDVYFDARSQRSETSIPGASLGSPVATRREAVQADGEEHGHGAVQQPNSLSMIWSRISVGSLGSGRRRHADGYTEQGHDGDAELPPDTIPVREQDPEADKLRLGCLPLFTSHSMGHKRYMRTVRPLAGTSVKHMHMAAAVAAGTEHECWEAADATTFMVRSRDYMRNRVKEPSAPAIYRLLSADVFSFDFKLDHIARHVHLPPAPTLGPGALALPPDQQLPPLLIINIQLPTYPATLFGATDGEGHSLVYYFGLPEGWEPSQVENKAALALLQRFIHNGTEADRTPTRDRLKLIPRVVNVEEWSRVGPLNMAESRLLTKYNDKPVMTKPQHAYFTGPSYFEIDLNIHGYAYLARKAFTAFTPRLAPVIFENAFVVQGNSEDELPEVILGCARMTRIDFTKKRPFPAQGSEKQQSSPISPGAQSASDQSGFGSSNGHFAE